MFGLRGRVDSTTSRRAMARIYFERAAPMSNNSPGFEHLAAQASPLGYSAAEREGPPGPIVWTTTPLPTPDTLQHATMAASSCDTSPTPIFSLRRYRPALGLGLSLLFACHSQTTPPSRHQPGTAQPATQAREGAIAVNQVGYIARASKRASVVVHDERFEPLHFELRTATEGRVVFESSTQHIGRDAATNARVHIADFSELRTPGRYRLVVEAMEPSPEFEIAPTARQLYPNLAEQVMQSLYLQRFGESHELRYLQHTGPEPEQYVQGKVYGADDASLEFSQGFGTASAAGGHIDAGSNGWYAANQAVISWHMLHTIEFFQRHMAWNLGAWTLELPEKGGDVPDILDEAEYSARKVLGVCPSAPAHAHQNCGSAIHDGEGHGRRIQEVTTQASMSVARIAAHTARVLAPYDAPRAEEYWAVAESAFQRWSSQPRVWFSLNESKDGARGGYKDLDLDDDAYAAAAELYLSARAFADSDSPQYLERLRSNPYFNGERDPCPSAPDWGEYAGGDACAGTMSLLTVDSGLSVTELQRLRKAVTRLAERLTEVSENDGFGAPIVQGEYRWGSLHEMQADISVLAHAQVIEGSGQYLTAIVNIFDHLMGRNIHQLAFVAGWGSTPESRVHNARWPTAPYGVTPGGPLNRNFIPPAYQSARGCGIAPDLSTRCDVPVCAHEHTPMTPYDALNYKAASPGNWCSTENTTNGAASMLFATLALYGLMDGALP